MTTPKSPANTAARERPVPCRWSYANSMSFAFCVTHSDYHRTFLTPPTTCPTALRNQLEKGGA